MNSKTQMMGITSTELFYIFRRVSVLFFMLVFYCFHGQITLLGDVVVVNDKDSAHFSSSLPTHHVEIPVRDKKHSISTNTSATGSKRKKSTAKDLSADTGESKKVYTHRYLPAPSKENLLTSVSASKTVFSSNNEYPKKHLLFIYHRHSAGIFDSSTLNDFTIIFDCDLQNSCHFLKIRPPPGIATV